MNVLVVLSTAPHPLDPRTELRAAAGQARPPGAPGTRRRRRPVPQSRARRTQRGFINTERYFL